MKLKQLLFTFALATFFTNVTAADSDEAEIKKYCEDAATVMQAPADKRDGYIAECIEARKDELSSDD